MKPLCRKMVLGALAALLLCAARAWSAPPVQLTVQSDPVGASVMLDGERLNVKTPLRLSVRPGVHEITISKPGFKESTRKIEVYSGAGFVSFQLETQSAPAPRPAALPAPARAPAPATAPAPPPAAPKARDATAPRAAPRGQAAKSARIGREAPPPEAQAGPVTIQYRGGPAEEQKPTWHLLPSDNPFPRAAVREEKQPAPAPQTDTSAAEEPAPDENEGDGVFPLVVRGQDPKQAALAAAQAGGDSAQAGGDSAQAGGDSAQAGGDSAQAGGDSAQAGGDSEGEPESAPEPSAPAPAPAAPPGEDVARAAAPESPAAASAPVAPRCLSGDSAAANPPADGDCIPAPEIEWPASAEDLMHQAAADLPQFPEKFNILLLGLDRRDRKGILATGAAIPDDVLKRKPANSDVIAVVQLDFIARRVRVVSIPRDTKVRVPGRGSRKINSAYAYGREKMSRRVIESFLGVPIHRTVVADWKGAKECIALFKGMGLDYNGFSEKELFWHLRKRSFARSDFHRIERQQTFLRYAAGEFMRMYNEARQSQGTVAAVKKSMLDMALKQGISAVDTDMTYEEAQLLAYAFRDYNVRDMTLAQVTGRGGLEGGGEEEGGEEEGGVYFFNASSHHSFDEIVARAEAASRNP
ncbi:MAG TPA: LCP family protein [bacterium]|nr:LCP family protein [bacterium]